MGNSFDDILDEFEEGLIEKEKINLIAFIMDASGSMTGSEKFVCDCFNKQLKIAKEQKDQETLVTLVKFNTTYNDSFIPKLNIKADYVNRQVDKVKELKKWSVDGGTPLHDAVGHTISKLKHTVEQNKGKDISVLVIVITDGAENMSQEYKGPQIKNIVKELEEEGNWTFTFLGADIDVFAEAEKMSFSSSNNIASFDKSDSGFADATKRMSIGTTTFYNARSVGEKSIKNYYNNENESKNI